MVCGCCVSQCLGHCSCRAIELPGSQQIDERIDSVSVETDWMMPLYCCCICKCYIVYIRNSTVIRRNKLVRTWRVFLYFWQLASSRGLLILVKYVHYACDNNIWYNSNDEQWRYRLHREGTKIYLLSAGQLPADKSKIQTYLSIRRIRPLPRNSIGNSSQVGPSFRGGYFIAQIQGTALNYYKSTVNQY